MLVLGCGCHAPRHSSSLHEILPRGLTVVHNVLRKRLQIAAQCLFDGCGVWGHLISGQGSALYSPLSLSHRILLPLTAVRSNMHITHSHSLALFARRNSSAVIRVHAPKFSSIESSFSLYRNECHVSSISMRPSNARRQSRRWEMSPRPMYLIGIAGELRAGATHPDIS